MDEQVSYQFQRHKSLDKFKSRGTENIESHDICTLRAYYINHHILNSVSRVKLSVLSGYDLILCLYDTHKACLI